MVGFIFQQYQRVVVGLVLLAGVIAAGTVGYMIIEGWSFLDSLYMAVISITTVGFREVEPLSTLGTVFTIVLLLVGVGSAFYILTALAATIIEGDLRQVFGERRMRTTIERIKDHHIICGYGRVGEEIAREFKDRDVPFIIVDKNPEALERARREGMLAIEGDATWEQTLLDAGILRCRTLIAASDSDAGNTYIILTAKLLRQDVFIVARVSTTDNEAKLLQAGADRVVSPYAMGGRRMAVAAIQPILSDFIDIVTAGAQGGQGILAEFAVDRDSGLAGQALREVLADCKNVVVLAVRSERGTMIVGPSDTTRLAPGDRLMVFGSEDDLRRVGAVRQEVTGS